MAAAKTDDDFGTRLESCANRFLQAIYLRRDLGLDGFIPVSMSCRTVIKGQVHRRQLGKYYPDLHEPDYGARGAVPSAVLDQNFPGMVAGDPYDGGHNGEINTLSGNVTGGGRRQASVHSELYGKEHQIRLWRISMEPVRTPPGFGQRARITGAGRLLAAARRHDDDSGSLGRQPLMDEKRPRVLRISRRPDGAVGTAPRR